MITRKGITFGKGTPIICVPVVAEKKEDILAWKISNMICEGLYMIDILENFLNENDLELPLTRMLVDIVNHWEEPKWLFDKFLESA